MASLAKLINPAADSTTSFSKMGSASAPRATYFVPSFNTSSTFYGATFYDSEFNKIGYTTNYSYYGSSGAFDQLDTTYQSQGDVFNGLSASQSTQSSSSGFFLNGLWNGEYGCALTRGSSRGVLQSNAVAWPTYNVSTYASMQTTYVNSDHSKHDTTIQLRSGYLTASPLMRPWDGRYGEFTSLPGSVRKFKLLTSSFPSGTEIGSMRGSASYNAVRKELVVMAHNSNTNGRFDVAIWKNVDWDANNCDVSQLPNTPSASFSVNTTSWNQTDNESRYNIKPVLVDNGSIYYTIMFQSSNYRIYRIDRSVDDTSGTLINITGRSITTSYGQDQGEAYGQRSMSTRSGNMVVTYCPYYYYASGIRSFVIDKRNSEWEIGAESNDSTHGMNPLKYRDDSFAFVTAGNYYAGNYSAISNWYFVSPSQTAGGKPRGGSAGFYLPTAPGPNTTNYVGVYQVWDYDLQTIPPAYSGRNS